MKRFWLLLTHLGALAAGFALGVYLLPILTAPEGPSAAAVAAQASAASFRGRFERTRKDSDALHWGEGAVSVGPGAVALMGRLAPGPDYKLYLSPEFVETEEHFLRIKAQMLRVGDVKTFENFLIPLPAGADPARYTTVIVWCEAFGQFITSAKYR